MWPFKRKLNKVETSAGIVTLNGYYTLDDNPFSTNRVQATSIRYDTKGIPWVKYRISLFPIYLTKRVDSFLQLYKYIKD